MSRQPPPEPPSDETAPRAGGAVRRVRLAGERTELAWWRTGLAAIAVAIAVGKVIPGFDEGSAGWPYAVVGLGFAAYGVALIAYGSSRARAVERAVDEGGFPEPRRGVHLGLAGGGILLGLLTALLIVFD